MHIRSVELIKRRLAAAAMAMVINSGKFAEAVTEFIR